MDVFSAIRGRREITQYTPESIEQPVMEQLIEAMYLAPTGNNLPSREFIVVTDRDQLQQLTPATPFMKWLEHAAAGIVIIGNPAESKYWLQDATIAGSYLWLAAVSLGLGAAWGAIYHSEDMEESARRESYVRERLGIPDGMRVVAVIGLGYPAIQPAAKTLVPLERVLHIGSYGRGE